MKVRLQIMLVYVRKTWELWLQKNKQISCFSAHIVVRLSRPCPSESFKLDYLEQWIVLFHSFNPCLGDGI